jgi:CheY-like chemotaxis protein
MTAQEKVLIVDDEENERSGLAELITAWGYPTETAKDGLEGLEKVAAWFPAIVLADFRMPRMDGIELLERLGEQPQSIAVILLTAQGNIEVAVDAMKADKLKETLAISIPRVSGW